MDDLPFLDASVPWRGKELRRAEHRMNATALPELTPILRYILLFIGVGLEGPLATMTAGSLIVAGYVNPAIAFAVIIAADIVSDSLYYTLGFWGREKLVKSYGHFLGLSWPRIHRFERLLNGRAGRVLMIGKWTHLVGVPVLVSAGIAKVRFSTFLIYDTIATLPKSFAFLLVGVFLGSAIDAVDHGLMGSSLIIGGILLVMFIAYLGVIRYVDHKSTLTRDE